MTIAPLRPDGSAKLVERAAPASPPLLRCSTCELHLPPSEFFHSKTKRGRGYRCRACGRAYSKARRQMPRVRAVEKLARERRKAEDPAKVHAHKRRARVRRDFGISYEEYESIRSAATACKICGTREPNCKGFVLDHKHGVAAVRGVLCDACNRGLGFFRDDPDRLEAAARYLRDTV